VIDDLSTGRAENLNPEAEFHQFSVCDRHAVKSVIAGCRFVFHGAALPRIQPSFEDPLLHEEVNVGGTINCLEAARDAGGAKFLYFSSSAVYGTAEEIPTSENAPIQCDNPYALQKYAAEQYCLMLGARWGVPAVSLRMFSVYGPRSYIPGNPLSAYSPVIGVFSHQRAGGGPLTITGDGLQARDFVHAYDVARAFLMAAESDVAGEVFNVGVGDTITVKALADLMFPEHTHLPERPAEARITHADIGKIKRMLGWKPEIPVAKGLTLLEDEARVREVTS
jgi:UDP-glucose 4-epimerase